MITKIKTFFRKIDLKKLKSIYMVILVFLLTALMLTFLNDVIINYWIIIISVFIPAFIIFIVSYILWSWFIKKQTDIKKDDSQEHYE